MSKEAYKAAYSLLFPTIGPTKEPFLSRLFSPSPAQADQYATRDLLKRASRLHQAFDEEARQNVAATVVGLSFDEGDEPPVYILQAYYDCVRKLQEFEPALFDPPTISDHLSIKEEVAYRAYLRQCVDFHEDTDASVKSWAATVMAALTPIMSLRFPRAETGIDMGEEPLLSFVHDIEPLVTLYHVFFADSASLKPLKEQLWRNLCNLNGVRPEDKNARIQPPVHFLSKDVSAAKILFANTPLLEALLAPVPIRLPERIRFEHHYIVGGTGHGKSKTFEQMIVNDIRSTVDDEATVVVMEPDGALIERISRLSVFSPDIILDKLTVIDPRDIEYPLALNMFDMNMERLSTYSPLVREQAFNGMVELFDYVFSSLLASELTGKQSTLFRFVMRLMLTIPNATIQTLREIFEPEGFKNYERYAQNLTGAAAHFFRTEWNAREFSQTKSQILRRIWQLLENRTFERMFSHPHSRLDLSKEINEGGRVILINTAQDLLKQEGSELFGRFFIALIAQIALERAAIPESQRKPVFFYIDEAAPYIDKNIETILTQARKYKVGLILAHQHLGQIPANIRQTLAANTSIKMAGGVSNQDAAALARDMRCEPSYIDKMGTGEFATYIKGVTASAIRYRCDFGVMDSLNTLDYHGIVRVKEEMRARYSEPAQIAPAYEEKLSPVTDDDLKPQKW